MRKIAKVFLFIFLLGCNSSSKEVDLIGLVVPDKYEGEIYIFFNQNKNKGKLLFKQGVHFFYIPSDGVVFTESKLGKGEFEFYNNDLEKISYPSSMRIKDLNLNDYLVTGGIYSSFELRVDSSRVEKINFVYFTAGRKSEINLQVNEDVVRSVYLMNL